MDNLGGPVEIAAELELLDGAFEEMLRALPVTLRDASKRLEERVGLRPDANGKWTGRLAPLTVLYPLLQAEDEREMDLDHARRATLAHVCLLVYAFVDDRRLDGQLKADDDESRFAQVLRAEGLCMLSRLPGYGPRAQSKINALLEAYESSRDVLYVRDARGSRINLTQRRIREVASNRAAYGAVATMGLVACANAESPRQRRIQHAFDALVTALQWSDDLSDWKEDLVRGEDNLLLRSLEARGVQVYRPEVGDRKVGAVAGALVEHGVLGYAAEQARRWYAAASSRQRLLGCPTLARMIDDRAGDLEGVLEDVTIRAHSDRLYHALRIVLPKQVEAR